MSSCNISPHNRVRSWLRILSGNHFRDGKNEEAGRKSKTRWPLLSSALPLRRLKPASVGPRRSERERERRGNTHSPSGLVKMWIFLFLQSKCLLTPHSLAFLSLFPRSLKPSTSYIICFPLSFYPSNLPWYRFPSFLSWFLPLMPYKNMFILFFLPSFFPSFFSPFHPSHCPFIFSGLVWNPRVEYEALETLIMFDYPVQKSTVNIRYWALIWSCQLLPVGDL